MAHLEELLPEFRKGVKIRATHWDKNSYIEIKNGEIVDCKGTDVGDLPFYKVMDNDWEFYREPEPDWDYIIKNKCLCWFWCKDEEERKIAGYLSDYDSYNSQFGRYKGKNVAVTYFDYCRPVRRDEVTFYEDRKDE